MNESIYPEKFKKLKRRNLQIFSFGNLSFGFADACVMIVIIPLYMELTGSESITGLLITFFMLMAFIPAPLSGKLSDKYGRRIMKIIPTGFLGGLLIEYVHFLTPFIITTIGIIIELWYIIKFGENLKNIEKKLVITKIEERSLLEFPYEP
jgi:MFS family permease